jgi:UvrD-like helicase C-terminal domain/AAA domain
MDRPLINYSIDQLEAEYDAATQKSNVSALARIDKELGFRRRTTRVAKLMRGIERQRHSNASPISQALAAKRAQGELLLPLPGTHRRGSKPGAAEKVLKKAAQPTGRTAHTKWKRSAFKHTPTDEQEQVLDAFLSGGSVKVNAYAGTGKTSTLEMLAHSTDRRGQYLAFNKDIVKEAKERFPSTVNCATTHSIAFHTAPSAFKANIGKMTGKMNANKLAELLEINKNWRVDKDNALRPRSQAAIILETLRKFTQSASLEPTADHVPVKGSLLGMPEETLKIVREFAVNGAKEVWKRMQTPEDVIPLGHDGYLKLWALSEPTIAADFILLDEAQDTNPVVLDVLRKQSAQMIYVGDRFQQIYEWRGAVNAMEEIETDTSAQLAQSFRFGNEIAFAATNVLRLLGAEVPLRGNPMRDSRIGSTDPQTILARTNANTITAIIQALDVGMRPYLVGGNKEIMQMLEGVCELKSGHPSDVPDFFGFDNWDAVVDFAKGGEGEHLLTFVNLVQTRGEKQLMWALRKTVDEESSNITISTAHKAKGREWGRVRLMDDFLKSQPKWREVQTNGQGTRGHDPAELRLFYVAMTRAKERLEVADNVLALLCQSAQPWQQPEQRSQSQPISTSPAPSVNNPANAWEKPKDWQPNPPVEAVPTAPTRSSPPPAPIRKRGLLGWLLGDSA